MNYNAQSHFANVPSVDIPRSRFDRSFDHKTTWKNGQLIPIYVDTTIMPGDTVSMNMSSLVRMTTPLTPVMDNCSMTVTFFFIPYRLVWDHFREFMGENTNGPWTQTTEYEIPQIVSPCHYSTDSLAPKAEYGWKTGTLADYMGYAVNNTANSSETHSYTKKDGTTVTLQGEHRYEASALPFRSYCLCWNEWWRDQNTQTPCYITKGDTTTRGHSYEWQGMSGEYPNGIDTNDSIKQAWYKNEAYVKYAETGALPLNVCKNFDMFTSCLPQPQKHDAIHIPLSDDNVGVKWGDTYNSSTQEWEKSQYSGEDSIFVNLSETTTGANVPLTQSRIDESTRTTGIYKQEVDLSQAVGATVTQIRNAFSIQRFYERQAYGGTRYIEQVRSHFHVTNPDFRVQRPEFLGGFTVPINMNQVVTTQESTNYPLGYTGGYSVTADQRHDLFTHSFTEHGILMGLACCRCNHSYQDGINEQFTKKKLFDFYWPELANLSNSPRLKKELYVGGTCYDQQNDDWVTAFEDEEAFGYNEAWSTERYKPDQISGMFRSSYPQSLDIWHYADYYTESPQLSADWMRETEDNLERTLAIQETDQFIGDFYFKAEYTRPMPLYSVPGLVDHY